MQVKENRVLVYTTHHLRSDYDFDGVRCWVPATEDARIAINYLAEQGKELHIDRALSAYCDMQTAVLHDLPSNVQQKRRIILYAQSDTLADSCAKVYTALLAQGAEVKLLVPVSSTEGAKEYFEKNLYPYEHFSSDILRRFKPDVVMVLCDWAKEVHRIFSFCKQFLIPTVCLQESIIDFGDSMNRMLYADEVFVQGVHTLSELKRSDYFISGNPRYKSNPYNVAGSEVLVNCNFTYGIFEDYRDIWLSAIQTALSRNHIPYKIVQHPRDMGKIERFGTVVRTNAQTLPPMLKSSKFVITRFSSIVHEALAQNVPVIYYNPHGETMKYDFGFNDTFLRYASNEQELAEAVAFLNTYEVDREEIHSYLAVHCIPKVTSAAEQVAHLLLHAPFKAKQMEYRDLLYRFLYYPPVLKKLIVLKRMISRK